MKDIIPLNEEQRRFATENHNLVYAFLNEKGLSEDEYYDVVIFGYLQAVNDFFYQKKLSGFSFSTLAWKRMTCHLLDYYKFHNRKSRKGQTVSLHAPADDGGFTWEEKLAVNDDLLSQLESELLLHDLAQRLPRQQMSVLRMRADGYGVREIARVERMTMRMVRSLIDDAYTVVVGVCSR